MRRGERRKGRPNTDQPGRRMSMQDLRIKGQRLTNTSSVSMSSLQSRIFSPSSSRIVRAIAAHPDPTGVKAGASFSFAYIMMPTVSSLGDSNAGNTHRSLLEHASHDESVILSSVSRSLKRG